MPWRSQATPKTDPLCWWRQRCGVFELERWNALQAPPVTGDTISGRELSASARVQCIGRGSWWQYRVVR